MFSIAILVSGFVLALSQFDFRASSKLHHKIESHKRIPNSPPTLPPCRKFGDTYGFWVNTSAAKMHPRARRHFYNEEWQEAIDFTHLWLPHNCSYLRFTNASILRSVQFFINSRQLTNNRLTVVFIGDSSMRSLFCGVVRVMSGSEVYGAVENVVCGGGMYGHVIAHKIKGWQALDYGNLTISYKFAKSFLNHAEHLDWQLEWAITEIKPFAVILTTGAWDFTPASGIHPVKPAGNEHCHSNETESISIARTSPFINATLWDMGREAALRKVSVYYKNTHYNKRYGVRCVDERLEQILDERWVI